MYILLDNFRSLTQINASVTAGRPGGVAGGGGGPAEAPLQSLGRRGHAGGKLYKIHVTRKTASTASTALLTYTKYSVKAFLDI